GVYMIYNLDLEAMASELDFDLEDVEMLVESFLETADESLEDMKIAIESNDMDGIFQSAHAIKGISANLTLNHISNIAKEIEMSARTSESIDFISKYQELSSVIKSIEG
ncbi:MAG: Hpt domain-containing protein, partial [Campylobacterales bacterium]|nr:Hpt domain-containing protein [Campylobacterales bacterium]